MLMTHVDLFEKILRCSLKDQKEMGDNGSAWWVDYEAAAKKEADFEWLLEEKRRRGSLPGEDEGEDPEEGVEEE